LFGRLQIKVFDAFEHVFDDVRLSKSGVAFQPDCVLTETEPEEWHQPVLYIFDLSFPVFEVRWDVTIREDIEIAENPISGSVFTAHIEICGEEIFIVVVQCQCGIQCQCKTSEYD
jgi:hypothetical protein